MSNCMCSSLAGTAAQHIPIRIPSVPATSRLVAPVAQSTETSNRPAACVNKRHILISGGMAACLWHATWAKAATAFTLPQNLDFTHLFQPEIVTLPRKALDLRFAVLLLRSTYDAVDAMNFVAMDKFQIQFWKVRQAEYEPYLLQYSPIRVRQGDLTDPLYFDFISFAQYRTMCNIIPDGQQVFKEYCEDCPEESKIVRRDAAFKDNALLPAEVAKRTGELIYDGLRNGFREEVFDGTPIPLRPDQAEFVPSRVQQLLDVFVDRGFAIKAQVTSSPGPSKGTFSVRLEGPANLWGVAALQSRQALMVNTVDAMTVQAYLHASGFTSDYSVQRSSTTIEQSWTFEPHSYGRPESV